MHYQGTILRTPDEAFEALPDYPFAPHYADVGGLRMHYVDEGPRDGKAIFLLHGQPSWSYLYRHMIPHFVARGLRVIAPDLIGFGKSDKPADPEAHTYQAHVEWMTALVRELGVRGSAGFFQDWGGMIGLRVLAREPQWLERLVLANTVLPHAPVSARVLMPLAVKLMSAMPGRAEIRDFAASLSFKHWLQYFKRSPTLEVGAILQLLTSRDLSERERAAYDAPFVDAQYYAGPRRMPQLVATQLGEAVKAWEVLSRWPHPVLTLFSDRDPFLAGKGMDEDLRRRLPGADGQPHHTVEGASHFLQEDQPQELATRTLAWLQHTGFLSSDEALNAVV